MAVHFTLTRIVPSLLVYLGLLAAALGIDLGLHLAGATQVGRWLGIAGAGLILVSFLYSLRKRKWIRLGQPKRLLQAHEVLGWVGAVAVLVHGGIHFNAFLPWAALAALLVVVASGLTGKFLLGEARDSLKARGAELAASGLAPGEIEGQLLAHSLLVETMAQWRRVHMPLTMVFVGLTLVHVASTLLFWRWSP